MKIIRPKLIGTLKIKIMMAGNFAVVNNVKNARNKIIIPCSSWEHGEEIIKKIKGANPGETLHI